MSRWILVALLGCLAASSSLASEKETAKAADLELELVTFNIRFPSKGDGPNQWQYRREILFDCVREMKADVMGVQEAFASQLKEITAAIPDYDYVGVGRDDGKEDGEHSAIFFNKSRFEKLGEGTFWLSDTPEEVASNTWDAACNRVCTWVALKDKATQRQFAVYNAHYDHRSTKARELSPVVIVQQMLANGHGELPLVLMGDFNSGPSSPQMTYLFEGKATLDGKLRESPITFINTLPADQSASLATYSSWRGRREGRQIDYVLLASKDRGQVKRATINRTNLEGRYPSDHYPVTATVVIPDKAAQSK